MVYTRAMKKKMKERYSPYVTGYVSDNLCGHMSVVPEFRVFAIDPEKFRNEDYDKGEDDDERRLWYIASGPLTCLLRKDGGMYVSSSVCQMFDNWQDECKAASIPEIMQKSNLLKGTVEMDECDFSELYEAAPPTYVLVYKITPEDVEELLKFCDFVVSVESSPYD